MKSDTNPDFIRYVQKKIMERLAILAHYCPKDMDPADTLNLKNRGAHIFAPNEQDEASACRFLILLLDCIEKWAKQFPSDERTGENTAFHKVYEELKQEKYCFPSQAKKRSRE